MNTKSIILFNNKLEKIPIFKKILVLSVIVALIIALFVFYIYKPKKRRIANLKRNVEALRKELKENKEVIKEIDALKEGLGEIERKFKEIQAQLPTKKEIPDLLAKISDLANLLGLEVLLFKPRPEQEREFYNEVPIEINMRGTYHDVNKFFEFISKLPRIVNIKNISMNNSKLVNKKVVINTNCMATTYRFSEKTAEKKKGKKDVKKKRKR
ncbi:MAG: type 4a pilus biogenesis protein PilO [bacterium]